GQPSARAPGTAHRRGHRPRTLRRLPGPRLRRRSRRAKLQSMNPSMLDILHRAPVVPVIVIHDLAQAVPLAEALVAGGLTVLEVPLRSPAGVAAIEAMRRAVPQAIVGVGTLTSPAHFAAARRAGAQFGVSPALSPGLLAASREAGDWPFLPGVMTPSEML